MTESEAIEYLKNRYLVVGSRINGGEKGIKRCEQHNESIDMAIKALEKQIPKKPDFTEDKEFALCPRCNGKGLLNKQKYCDNCGQKIDLDWRDEE